MMTVGMVAIPILILLALMVIGIPVLLGVWTYKDAKNRNMNAAVWTLIVVLVPSFIGFVIYLIVRSNHSDLHCPSCDATIREEFVSCPMCGARLKESCNECGRMVEPHWTVCPNCSQPLSHSNPVVGPARKKDKGLTAVVIVVFAVPVLILMLILLAFVGYRGFSVTGNDILEAGYSCVGYKEEEVAFKDNAPQEMKEWWDEAKNGSDVAYVLEYQYVTTEGQQETIQLLYWHERKETIMLQVEDVTAKGIVYAEAYVEEWDEESEDWATPEKGGEAYPWTLSLIYSDEDVDSDNVIIINEEEKISVEVTEVDYDFTKYLQADILIE